MNYYNENDPKAAAWLRELINAGLIPAGHIDQRSITDVSPSDLSGFAQCHFFAGIGGWPLALQFAGWPADRPVWTGSCPCQPFSAAGKQLAEKDERHLWPAFFGLIRQRNPVVVFGEQVANAIGKGWLDGISADLESEGYACGAVVLGAHSVGAPHIRQRLYWVADSASERRDRGQGASGAPRGNGFEIGCAIGGLEHATGDGREQRGAESIGGGTICGRGIGHQRMGEPIRSGLEGLAGDGDNRHQSGRFDADASGSTPAPSCASHWDAFDLLPCLDGKARRVEPGTFPLAHGIPGRVGLLRGYGNGIVPEAASEFIAAYREVTQDARRAA